jgi:hypothetical protein
MGLSACHVKKDGISFEGVPRSKSLQAAPLYQPQRRDDLSMRTWAIFLSNGS